VNESQQPSADTQPALVVGAGEDRFGVHRGLGISRIDSRVVPQDSSGLLILMAAFFREVTKANAVPAHDPALWRSHGMELLGPTLAVE